MATSVTRDKLEEAVLQAMDNAGQDMKWGHDDCGLWCANILQPILGYDPASHLRNCYSDRTSAYEFLGAGGVQTALAEIAKRHDWREIDPEAAEPGDVGLTFLKAKKLFAIVICRAPGWFVGRNERGWSAMRSNYVQKAFAVL